MRPCCYYNDGANQCKNLRADAYSECDDLSGTLGPEGVCCAIATVPPTVCPEADTHQSCWICENDIEPFEDYHTSCCFEGLDFLWIPFPGPGEAGLYTTQCSGCGGVFGRPQDECQRAPREQECVYAAEDREWYPGAPRWTLDTTGTVVFGLTRVSGGVRKPRGPGERVIPEREPVTPDEEWPPDWPRGYHYGLSTHLARPREPDTPENACGHAVGRFTMLDDGYCYAETCSLPDLNNQDSFRRSYGLLRTIEEDAPADGIQAGYQYDVTCIRLPAWTEALYRSHQSRCSEEER